MVMVKTGCEKDFCDLQSDRRRPVINFDILCYKTTVYLSYTRTCAVVSAKGTQTIWFKRHSPRQAANRVRWGRQPF